MTTPAAPVARFDGSGGGPPPTVSPNGHHQPRPDPIGIPNDASTYLEHLPGIYQESHFLARYLLIFEHILNPIDRTVSNSWAYFDPGLTPEEFLPWLGSWLGLALDIRIPEENRRAVIQATPELWRWRGTKRGLREFIRLYTGVDPEIVEPSLSDIANNRNLAYRFTVRVALPVGSPVQRGYLETIVEAEKPAFAGCTLEITTAP